MEQNNVSEAEITFQSKQTEIERIMSQLNPKWTEERRRDYLKGWIDSQYDSHQISDEIRGKLYEIYGELSIVSS